MGRIGWCRRGTLVTTLVMLVVAGAWACDADPDSSGDGRSSVVTAFYPLAWVVEEVGGDAVAVSNLTPAGAEPHDLELTPAQRDEVVDADVAFVMGNGFQPAVEEAASQRDRETLAVFDALDSIDSAGDALDPHIWLDPLLMQGVVDVVADTLVEADPEHEAAFEDRAAATREALSALDAEYSATLAECETRVLVTAHDSFGYLTARYDLRSEGVAGLSPDAEPDPARLAELADLVEDEGVTVVFTETLVSPDIAETLASEAGVETEVLSPLEGLTDEQRDDGDDYLSVMRTNLAKIAGALGCRGS